jgi:hypothetical protein
MGTINHKGITMVRKLIVSAILTMLLLGTRLSAPAQEKKDEEKVKTGTAIGILVAKDKNFIEVKADGEEKGRRYVPRWVGGAPAEGGGPDKKMLKTFSELTVGSRVEVKWAFEERLRALEVKVLKKAAKKEDLPKDARTGKTVGILVGKADKFIELRGDGEETPRTYHARYLKGPPAGFDPEILHEFQKLTIGSRLQLDWISTNHGPQVYEVRVLKAAAEGK